jgi:hypothetical protein
MKLRELILVSEDASVGATSSADIATVAYPLFVRGKTPKQKRKNARAAVGQNYVPGPKGVGTGVYESLNEFAPGGDFKPPVPPKEKGNDPWGNDDRSKIVQAVRGLLKAGNKVDWKVAGQMGHVVSASDHGVIMKRWGKPYSKIHYSLHLTDDLDDKYMIKMKKPGYYVVVSTDPEWQLESVTEGTGQEPGEFEIINLQTMQRVYHPFEADNIMDAQIKADDWLEAIGKSGRGLMVRPVKEQGVAEGFTNYSDEEHPIKQDSPVEAHGYAYNNRDQRVMWAEQGKGKIATEAYTLDNDNVIYRLDRENPMSDTEVAVLGGAGRYSLKALRDKARREAAALAQDLSIEHGGAFRRSAENIKQLTNTINTIVAAYNELARIRRKGGRGSRGITDEDANFIRECIRVVEQATQNYRLMEGLTQEPDPHGYAKDVLTTPKYTIVVNTPGDLDWYKVGTYWHNKIIDPHEFGQDDSDTVLVAQGAEEYKQMLAKLKQMGLTYKIIGGTTDQPEIHDKP